MKAANYPIIVFYSENDGVYIADVPDLEHCSASGHSPEEAIREVGVAMKLWLETSQEDGDPIPEPRSQPQLAALMTELTRIPVFEDEKVTA